MSPFPVMSGPRSHTARRGTSGDHAADAIRMEGPDGVHVVLRDEQAPPWPAGTEEALRSAAPGAVTVLLTTALDAHEVDGAVTASGGSVRDATLRARLCDQAEDGRAVRFSGTAGNPGASLTVQSSDGP